MKFLRRNGPFETGCGSALFIQPCTKNASRKLRRNFDNCKRILSKDYNLASIKQGEWILLNKKHIEELQMQNYGFPDFSILNSQEFKKVATFNDYIFYEKLH